MKLRVKEILKSQHISQKELADRMGILPESLARVLAGGNPTLLTLEKLSKSLNVNIAELFDDEKVEKKINGFIEIDNVVYKIKSIEDFEKIYKLLKR